MSEIYISPVRAANALKARLASTAEGDGADMLGNGVKYVQNLAELAGLTASTTGNTIIFTDAWRGGIFKKIAYTATPNNITTYNVATTAFTLQRVYSGPIDVKWAGAVPSTNSLAAFQACAASGFKHFLADDAYIVDGQINVQSGQAWDLTGSVLTQTGNNKVMFNCVSVDDWKIKGGHIVGGGNVAGTAVAIHANGCKRWYVDSLTIEFISGQAILVAPGAPSGTLRGDKGHVLNVIVKECYIGWQDSAGYGAEYCMLLNPMITGCAFAGMITSAGNITVLGGNIVDNVLDGVKLVAGGNHAHGIFSAVNINHNGQFNIVATDIVYGQTFANCHIYGNALNSGSGAIFLNRCKGIVFDGGHLDCWVYNYEDGSSGYNYIQDMYCPGSYGDVQFRDASNLPPKKLIALRCTGAGAYKAGVTINDPSPVYVNAYRVSNATQAITPGTTLIFPTTDQNGDRRGAYNAATGIFTVPVGIVGQNSTGMAGQYRVSADLIFSGMALVASNSYVEIRINDNPKRLIVPTAFGSTKLTASISSDFYLNEGDTVKLVTDISGAAPVFGDTTYQSGLSITRLA